jgi:hypothetical protein
MNKGLTTCLRMLGMNITLSLNLVLTVECLDCGLDFDPYSYRSLPPAGRSPPRMSMIIHRIGHLGL